MTRSIIKENDYFIGSFAREPYQFHWFEAGWSKRSLTSGLCISLLENIQIKVNNVISRKTNSDGRHENVHFLFSSIPSRIMSQYEVQLVNENMQEFYVKFTGPSESMILRFI